MPSNRRRLILQTMAATVAGLTALAALVGGGMAFGGWYNVSSTDQHFQITHTVLEQTMHAWVRRRASAAPPPPASTPALIRQGASLYVAHCQACHGAPGVAQEPFGKSMQPVPGPLVDAARRWQPKELYWITRHGIKMSGMPAWEYHLSEQQLWAVVTFLAELPRLDTRSYAAMARGDAPPAQDATPAPAAIPDPARGRVALTQYACHACHLIPGVTGSRVYVGPPLAGVAARRFIAGRVPNSFDGMVGWIRDPQRTDPRTAMPNLGVSEADARDIAAYLQTLR
ncbi:c-type cytochrome [Pseudoduganella namucuonensis]|uniref:Cytochrome c n=1 Tax=Pseudoduganella namucuonensis TaxID=1035707 RepID=A0A1I7M216_9BURK|nr:c-type cytochrome [Pseudoduganella namucuonensis]SFV15976.1 Cytochrome c [Pseudoduganella namucuonensis]